MRKLIYLIAVIFSSLIFGQENKQTKIEREPITSETEAEFPGGMNAFGNEFSKHFNINLVQGKGQVKAVANFIIERDGSLVQVKVNGNNESLNQEMKRALESIKTKWKPGTVNNSPVRTRHKFPVTLNL